MADWDLPMWICDSRALIPGVTDALPGLWRTGTLACELGQAGAADPERRAANPVLAHAVGGECQEDVTD